MTTIGGRNFPHSSQSGTAVHESFPIVSLTCCGVGDGPRSRSRTVIVLWCMFAVLAYCCAHRAGASAAIVAGVTILITSPRHTAMRERRSAERRDGQEGVSTC